jgi:putative FmdB family regulatory protein
MPLYEYVCESGHVAEKLMPIDAPESIECGECGEPSTRVFSTFTGVFLGEGFYKPSPSGRTSSKNADPHRVLKELNDSAGGNFIKKHMDGAAVQSDSK